jgi:hypothetical protein
VITGMVTLTSPVAGGIANAEYLAISGNYLYLTSGSESNPLGSSSTIQVVNKTTMSLVGSPIVVPHSPQQIAIQGNVAYVTLYDAAALESIDISNPTAPKPLQIVALSAGSQNCSALPIAVQANVAYVGCYSEGAVNALDVSNPSAMKPLSSVSGISYAQRIAIDGGFLRVTGSAAGGQVYQIDLREF